ncbi:MAG: hypothetical protein JO192_04395 [Candidatus Eremiobacteraeota bacterium]|nr:hypothetical protein [Candidatus Eremiobacteraeota bacterium]
MNTPLRRPVTLAWFAVLALGGIGYGTIVAPSEREVRAVSVETANVYQLAARNERALQRGADVAAAARRVRRDLTELRGAGGSGKPTLDLLTQLDAASKLRRVSFRGIVPGGRSAQESGTQAVSLSLSGEYGDILSVISDLTRHRTVVGVDSVRLSRAPQTDGDAALLDAAVSATLYFGLRPFERPADREEATSVRSPER